MVQAIQCPKCGGVAAYAAGRILCKSCGSDTREAATNELRGTQRVEARNLDTPSPPPQAVYTQSRRSPREKQSVNTNRIILSIVAILFGIPFVFIMLCCGLGAIAQLMRPAVEKTGRSTGQPLNLEGRYVSKHGSDTIVIEKIGNEYIGIQTVIGPENPPPPRKRLYDPINDPVPDGPYKKQVEDGLKKGDAELDAIEMPFKPNRVLKYRIEFHQNGQCESSAIDAPDDYPPALKATTLIGIYSHKDSGIKNEVRRPSYRDQKIEAIDTADLVMSYGTDSRPKRHGDSIDQIYTRVK